MLQVQYLQAVQVLLALQEVLVQEAMLVVQVLLDQLVQDPPVLQVLQGQLEPQDHKGQPVQVLQGLEEQLVLRVLLAHRVLPVPKVFLEYLQVKALLDLQDHKAFKVQQD
jgi:hypothetical protein